MSRDAHNYVNNLLNLSRFIKISISRHSTHENQTDSIFLVGSWLNWLMKKIDPNVGVKINNCLLLEFLHKYTRDDGDISDCQEYLKKEAKNYYSGLTLPWA